MATYTIMNISEETYRKIKLIAAIEGMTIKDLFMSGIQREIQDRQRVLEDFNTSLDSKREVQK